MKMVIAVVQPTKLSAVHEALNKLEVTRMTVCDAQGYARQRGQLGQSRDKQHATRLLRKVELQIVVNDDFLDRTVEAIASVARTGLEGAIGDGKVFVVPVEEAIQIEEPVRGPGAV